jgi:hypothetical protein
MHTPNGKRIEPPAIRLSLHRSSLIGLAAMAFAVATLANAPGAFAKDDLGPGCAPDRPAIAHHAGGITVRPDKEERAPIPCVTSTGWRTSEVSIAIGNEGSVLVQPALDASGLPIGLLRSVNRGGSWDFVNPTVAPARALAIDMNLAVDRDTGRVFWSSDLTSLSVFGIPSRNGNLYIDHSDDDGKTWVRSSPLSMDFDHTQLFTGPPTASLGPAMHGYPNVVYVVVAGGYTCFVFNFCGTHVATSLDGGMTFGQPVALPYPPDCPAPGTNPTGGYGLKGFVSPDGTVYLPFTPCEQPYIAISHDAGATWQLVLVSNAETIGWGELGFGMDKQGNLYAAWTGFTDRLLYLSISQNHGLDWSAPLMMAAPGVNETAELQLVVGARGQVAVSYYGSKNAPLPFPPACNGGASLSCPGYENETWNTYVTETWNALAKQPLFWSASLNDPADSTWYGFTPSSLRIETPSGIGFGGSGNALPGSQGTNTSGHIDYYGMAMAPDNTPWVGFVQECPFGLPVGGNPNCGQAAGGANDGLWGLVGRLVRAQHDEE